MKTERELIEYINGLMLADMNVDPDDHIEFQFKGPFTTTYWSNVVKDNILQQVLTVTVDGKTFDVIVRERK